MDAVTYPNPEVIDLLNSEFLPVQINTEDSRELNVEHEVYWEPKFTILSQRRLRIREWMGYLAPQAFLAELKVALGLYAMRSGQNEDALRRFERVAREHPDSPAAPEALYWQGIVHFRLSKPRDKQALWQDWREGLVARYPASQWAMKTTMLEHPAGWAGKPRPPE